MIAKILCGLFLLSYYITFLFSDLEYLLIIIINFTLFPLVLALIMYKFTKLSFIICYFIAFIIQWIIFLNVNPYPFNQDNKLTIMNLVPSKFKPDIQFSLSDIYNISFNYPIIIKPTICSGNSGYITIVRNRKELDNYLVNCKNINYYMVQNYLYDYDVEIGVLWGNGRILEIVEKTNKIEFRTFDENHFINHSNLINNNLNNLFNQISSNIPNLNVARYDIRLKSINDLNKGNFKILEINGTMGMAYLGYPTQLGIYVDTKWYYRRILIGLYNIFTLNGYSPIILFWVMIKSYINSITCHDWENIYSLYS